MGISYVSNNGGQKSVSEVNITELEKDNYNITFSYNENNCNYTIFKSEYLLCCGKTDQIICERRDRNFQYIESFKIISPGKITNLTIEKNDDDSISLFYTNKSSEEKYIYLPINQVQSMSSPNPAP